MPAKLRKRIHQSGQSTLRRTLQCFKMSPTQYRTSSCESHPVLVKSFVLKALHTFLNVLSERLFLHRMKQTGQTVKSIAMIAGTFELPSLAFTISFRCGCRYLLFRPCGVSTISSALPFVIQRPYGLYSRLFNAGGSSLNALRLSCIQREVQVDLNYKASMT